LAFLKEPPSSPEPVDPCSAKTVGAFSDNTLRPDISPPTFCESHKRVGQLRLQLREAPSNSCAHGTLNISVTVFCVLEVMILLATMTALE
jgi:hypothetical protein